MPIFLIFNQLTTPMTIAVAETLKQELTDKYVVVAEGIPELRRFEGLTGQVKTVNMNGRALVEFDSPEDISWYDIDPSCLKVVDAPRPKAKQAAEKPEPAAKGKPAPSASGGGKSPLEMARQQGAPKADSPVGEKKLSPLEQARQQGAPKTDSGSKPSPLEQARQQGAAKAKSEAPSKAPAAETSGKKLSPLELARQQGAAGQAKAEAATPATPQPPAEEASSPPAEPPTETPAEQPSEPSAPSSPPTSLETPSSTAEIIALARQQGAFKG
jgi:hypothetical protein